MKKRLLVLFLIMLVVTLGVLQITSNAAQTKQVNIAMTYIPNVQFAPWYVAAEKGFFKAEGLDVKFDYRMDIDALPLVANGQMDFAIAGGDQVIVARSKGIPVVYLTALYAKFPPSIISLAKSGIQKPQDLKGKKIGLPLYGTNLLAVKAILYQSGLSESDVQLIDVGYTQVPSLTSGKVDAVVGFANNEPLILKAAGQSINQINAWEYFPLVGHGLISGEKQIADSPKMVKSMVKATVKGIDYALAHPDETFSICLKHIPDLSKEQYELQKKILLTSMELWKNQYTEKHGLGQNDPKAWEESQQFMQKYGLIDKTTPVKRMVNTGFIPKVK